LQIVCLVEEARSNTKMVIRIGINVNNC